MLLRRTEKYATCPRTRAVPQEPVAQPFSIVCFLIFPNSSSLFCFLETAQHAAIVIPRYDCRGQNSLQAGGTRDFSGLANGWPKILRAACEPVPERKTTPVTGCPECCKKDTSGSGCMKPRDIREPRLSLTTGDIFSKSLRLGRSDRADDHRYSFQYMVPSSSG